MQNILYYFGSYSLGAGFFIFCMLVFISRVKPTPKLTLQRINFWKKTGLRCSLAGGIFLFNPVHNILINTFNANKGLVSPWLFTLAVLLPVVTISVLPILFIKNQTANPKLGGKIKDKNIAKQIEDIYSEKKK